MKSVSIIMPVYNGAKFLDESIQSVVNQSYSEWDLYVIDDSSRDESLAIARRWQSLDSRIHVLWHINHENRGVSASRNLGILSSYSEYVALLDCDDTWHPSKLETQIETLKSMPSVGISYSQVLIIDANGLEVNRKTHDSCYFLHGIVGSGDNLRPADMFEAMALDEAWMPCSSVIMRRSAATEAGLFNINLRHQCEDHLLFTLVSYHTKACFVEKPLTNYRLHANSYSMSSNWKTYFMEYYCTLSSSINRKQYYIIDKGITQNFTAYANYSRLRFRAEGRKKIAMELTKLWKEAIECNSLKATTKGKLLLLLVNALAKLCISATIAKIRVLFYMLCNIRVRPQ